MLRKISWNVTVQDYLRMLESNTDLITPMLILNINDFSAFRNNVFYESLLSGELRYFNKNQVLGSTLIVTMGHFPLAYAMPCRQDPKHNNP